jgi:hypothetical protein
LRSKLKFIFDTAANNNGADQPRVRQERYQDTPQKRYARALRVLKAQLESDTAELDGFAAFAELLAESSPDKLRTEDSERAGGSL